MLTWPTGGYAPGNSRYNTLVLPYEFLVQFEIQKMSRLKTAKKKKKERKRERKPSVCSEYLYSKEKMRITSS